MKVKSDGFESFVYIVLCVISLGTIWLSRIVITMAIRKAVEE